ncbi:hypothetical protein FHS85_002042 [Rhodoligotrophos appendicifer]|uniref:DUF2934 domain-containing protein n=1 Tax=Rhodoligotrophos appendicifer TaxID=987056 RepID=UPI001186ED5E|nr:DUF2934 domain-containing protein [Rhodoligotrophos appendicifer]
MAADDDDDPDFKERIRRRAHYIWVSEGWPDGRHEQHWALAREQLEAEEGRRGSRRPSEDKADD